MYATTVKAKQYYGVSADTLRRWANKDKIKFRTTKGGHRRYFIPKEQIKNDKRKIAYARVSSNKQKSDLQNQINFLSTKYPDHEIISDIGSGINFKRRGFKTILEQVFDCNVEEVVVATKDRFSRFGFELFEDIFTRFEARLVTVESDEGKEKQYHEELAEDLMSIVTVFAASHHGKRKYKNKTNKSDKVTKTVKSDKVTKTVKSDKVAKTVKKRKMFKK
jgi:putative resolvase